MQRNMCCEQEGLTAGGCSVSNTGSQGTSQWTDVVLLK